jgi:hypothetical protein
VNDDKEVEAIELIAHRKRRLQSIFRGMGLGGVAVMALGMLAILPASSLDVQVTMPNGFRHPLGFFLALFCGLPLAISMMFHPLFEKLSGRAWVKEASLRYGVPAERLEWVVTGADPP